MPIEIICKPVQIRPPRPYSMRDLRRIARFVNDGGVPWPLIVGQLAAEAGLREDICKIARILSVLSGPVNAIVRALRPLAGLAALAAVRRLARILQLLGLRLPPRVAALFEALALLLVLLQELDVGTLEVLDDIELVAGVMTDLCEGASLPI